jgi:VCBS repeat-containing protein
MAIINGTTGNNNLSGTGEADIINGGAGSDILNAGGGNDLLIYRLSENTRAKDQYNGNAGRDTLRMDLTSAEWSDALVRSELNRYASSVSGSSSGLFGAIGFLTDLIAPLTQALPFNPLGFLTTFTFNFGGGTTLAVNGLEELQIYVDGQLVNVDVPVFSAAGGAAAVFEDGNTDASTATRETASGSVVFLDGDFNDTHVVSVLPTSGSLGTFSAQLTNSAQGDGQGSIAWSFALNNASVQYLGAGQVVQETYTVRVADANNSAQFADKQVTLTITGANDAPTVAAALTADLDEGNAPVVLDLLQGASDVDSTDQFTIANVRYIVNGGAPSEVSPEGLSLSAASLTVDASSTAFEALQPGQSTTIVVTFDVVDNAGAKVPQSQTVVINGTPDGPSVLAPIYLYGTEGISTTPIDFLQSILAISDAERSAFTLSNMRIAVSDVDGNALPGFPFGTEFISYPDFPFSQSAISTWLVPARMGEAQVAIERLRLDITGPDGETYEQNVILELTGVNSTPEFNALTPLSLNRDDDLVSINLMTEVRDPDELDASESLQFFASSYAVNDGQLVTGLPDGVTLSESGELLIDPSVLPAGDFLRKYDLQLTVVDSYGASATQVQRISLAAAPAPDITATAFEQMVDVAMNSTMMTSLDAGTPGDAGAFTPVLNDETTLVNVMA